MARVEFDRRPWVRRARVSALVLAVLLVVVGLVGFLVVPRVIKSVAEEQIAAQLGRKATIGDVAFNPFKLAATIRDFTLYEADGTTVFVKIDELLADVSSASLFKRAVVFDRLTVTRPSVRIARLEAQRFSFSDIADRLAAQSKSESPTRFSLNNIEIDGGSIDVDDRVTNRKHRVEDLRVALPFVSNLPYDATIFVTPAFSAKVDGSTIGLTGKAQPFSASRESALELNVDDLDLTDYVDLSPTKLPFRLASGHLSAKLALTFKATTKDASGATVPQSFGIGGHVGLASLAIADPQGRQAIVVKSIDIDIAKIDPFNDIVALQRVAVAEPSIDVTRRADGSIDLVDLFRMPAAATTSAPAPTSSTTTATTPAATLATTTATATAQSPSDAASPQFTTASARIDGGRVHVVDQTVSPATTFALSDIDAEADAVALAGTTPTTFRVAVATDDGATLDAKGSVVVASRGATGTIEVKGFKPARVAPYLAVVAARIDDGSIDAQARFRIDASKPEPTGVLDGIDVHVARLRTSVADARGGPFAPLMGADGIALTGGSFDLATRAFTAESLMLAAPAIAVRRDAKGHLNLNSAIVDAKPVATQASAAPAVEVTPVAARPFTAVVKAVSIERGDVSVDDLGVPTPVHVRLQPINATAGNLGTSMTGAIPFRLDLQVDKRGRLAVDGHATLAPLDVDAHIDAKQVAVGWLAAYAGDRLNIVIASADLDTKGALRVTQTPAQTRSHLQAQAANAAPSITYRGSLGIARMRALDKLTSDEFVSWKTLDVPTVDVRMPPNAPMSIALGTVALRDFYARVIVNANGRLNLQDVVASPGQVQSVTKAETTAAPAAPVVEAPPAPTLSTATPSTPPPSTANPSIRVAGIMLAGGRIGITDNFIKPNYSADLTDLNGDVGALSASDPKPAAIKLAGRIDGEGTLDVSGNLNPLAPSLYVDIAAAAKDIELTRLTPYAIKYAGYGIERGKLSTTVKYHIENGRLEAQNHVFLDQLTFGAHDASSSANLPVRLAVALLANSKGEIDIELPVSGSLSDPQFSIGGVLWRAFVNLLTRAVTSPFSLIGAAFGGGSHGELGYIQFKPGVSDLTDLGKTKLETLAEALADRPNLKLDIIGRYDPATDPDGIKRDHLLDRLKDAKAKDQSKGGGHVGRDEVTIDPGAEYSKYLAQVYDDTKLPNKPRNAIGLAKTISEADMESLMLASMSLDANDARWLAEARADVVRHYIEGTGKIAPGRVFLVAPKLTAAGIDDDGVPNRVDFALR